MDQARINRLHFVTILAIVYIIIGFGWWSVLLVRKNNDSRQLSIDNLKLTMRMNHTFVSDEQLFTTPDYAALQTKYNRQQEMIWGEGGFLFLGLLIGVWIINRSYHKEIALTQQHQNFLLSVTHELKSPIASISLMLQTIRRLDIGNKILTVTGTGNIGAVVTKEPPSKIQRLTTNALTEADRLNELVNNILLSTKLDKSYEINPETFDLVGLTDDIIEKYQMKFPKTKFDMDARDIPRIHADRQGLVSVLSNLIENSAKYGSDLGRSILEAEQNSEKKFPAQSITPNVKVKINFSDEKFTIDVSDNGIGVPIEERQKIFDKFYRVGNEMTRRTKGTGLGLYIVTQIVKAHKGSIRILDNTPQGSIFRVVVPNS